MINKIKNGIDVSECEYINCCSKKAKCIILQDDISSDSQYCESEPNCYFKQLKRLQKENEELKAENKQLKKPCLVMPKVNQLAVPIDKYEKLYKALEEIKEIAKYNQFYNPKYFMLRGDIGQIQNIKMTEIYEKCNEALNGRD